MSITDCIAEYVTLLGLVIGASVGIGWALIGGMFGVHDAFVTYNTTMLVWNLLKILTFKYVGILTTLPFFGVGLYIQKDLD